MTGAGRAALVAALALAAARGGRAQEDTVPPIRHILAIDYSRVKPFRRSFEIVLNSGDSAIVIGRRELSLEEIVLADAAPGWLLVESRTGTVGALDSLFLAPDLRPTRWHSTLGAATLDITFSSDSLAGKLRIAGAGAPMGAAVPPDVVVSVAELEMLAPLLPLDPAWSDSVSALTVSFAGATVEPVELVVMAEDSVAIGTTARSAWIVSMRSGARETRLWVDRENGDVLRTQQLLSSRVGTTLEYRVLIPPAP